jgi:hypothetical protein
LVAANLVPTDDSDFFDEGIWRIGKDGRRGRHTDRDSEARFDKEAVKEARRIEPVLGVEAVGLVVHVDREVRDKFRPRDRNKFSSWHVETPSSSFALGASEELPARAMAKAGYFPVIFVITGPATALPTEIPAIKATMANTNRCIESTPKKISLELLGKFCFELGQRVPEQGIEDFEKRSHHDPGEKHDREAFQSLDFEFSRNLC